MEFLHIVVNEINFVVTHQPKNLLNLGFNELLQFHNISIDSASRRRHAEFS